MVILDTTPLRYLALWLSVGWMLGGCGRIITPPPAAVSTVEQTPVATITPTGAARPTSTPPPVTPVATATPTLTPTPMIYVVQPGDTLQKIALQFDRSNEAIQEANGIIDPRFLEIGQTLIIPPAEVNPDTSPMPTPTPFPVTITAINFQKTTQGSLWCLGLALNPGQSPLTEVVIEASLLDGAGVLLAREAAFAQLDVIRPGQAVPFAILFQTPPSSFAQYRVGAVAAVPLSEQSRYYFELESFDVRGSLEGPATYRVNGQLRNRGRLDAEAIRLVVVAYDREDRVLAQRQADLAIQTLKARAATAFAIDLIIPKGVVDHVEVLAQGLSVSN